METLWEDIVANDPEWNAKLTLVPGLTDAWSGELKETFTKATEEFVVCMPLHYHFTTVFDAARFAWAAHCKCGIGCTTKAI